MTKAVLAEAPSDSTVAGGESASRGETENHASPSEEKAEDEEQADDEDEADGADDDEEAAAFLKSLSSSRHAEPPSRARVRLPGWHCARM